MAEIFIPQLCLNDWNIYRTLSNVETSVTKYQEFKTQNHRII